ncbi:cold-shock protein [Alsobacter sp. KACC 23698]|uniref:Cold-shock protein n=1 Tax=Alsobacter sp. KACC 23698 TaxID=3149229 RepID=A0AAU7JF26_9HYPH
MATGTVKWFNALKGYGFIVPDAGGADVFVHVTAVQRSGLRLLEKGQRIDFQVSPRGLGGKEQATDISPQVAGRPGAPRSGSAIRPKTPRLSPHLPYVNDMATNPTDRGGGFVQI